MKALATVALVIGLVTTSLAQPSKCHVCGKPIVGKFYQVEDRAHGGKVEVCEDCSNLDSRCFACSIPVPGTATKLTDGRFLCERDAKEAVQQEEEARKICLQTRDGLDMLFNRFLVFPATNILVNIVDRFTLESLFKSPGYGRRCTSVFGATSSHKLGEDEHVHTISILSSLSRKRLEAVAAHEFAHTWLNENLSPERKNALAPETVEAFCELIAYQWTEIQRADFEKRTIKENPYAKGQLEAMQLAEARHGFNAVLEWLQSGDANKLEADDPDGIRSVRATATPAKVLPVARAAAPTNAAPRPPTPLPEKLVLKGITGGPGRRLAIINDRTFGVQDLARMRLAKTNLLIRCLEIRTNSVLIRLEDTGVKQVLVLTPE